LVGRLVAALAMLCLFPAPAQAIPVFAHRYGVTCQACHTTVPHLNAVGQRFLADGYRAPGRTPSRVLPIAVKVNLAYSSAPDPTGLPKAIVDEVEVLSGGAVARRTSYFIEQYLIDGGRPGSLRDAWIRQRLGSPAAPDGLGVNLRAGQFTLPLPVDPETFRETQQHYAIYDQAVGANPFTFFAPHDGLDTWLATRGGSLHLVAAQGHDRQSGLPASGVDLMAYAEAALGTAARVSAYRYEGSRPLAPRPDTFWRQGAGLSLSSGKGTLTGVLQTGFDSSASGSGAGAVSSGGFAELNWAFSPRITAVGRYDGTAVPGAVSRSATFALVERVWRNSKFTLEDVIARGTHTLNAALLFAY
jgi:hypothetical protein